MQPTSSFSTNKKIFIIVAAAIGLLLIVGLIIFIVLNQKSATPPSAQQPEPSNFSMKASSTPERYANHPQYDACALLGLETVAKNTKGYETALESTTKDTDGEYPEILTMEHSYVDRPITQIQPVDASPRTPNKVIANGQITGDVQYISAFTSLHDTTCIYGEGSYFSGSGKGFAQVSVTQPPTPLAPEFLAYVASITPDQKETKNGLDIYTAKQRDGNGYFNALFIAQDRGLAIFLQAASEELLQAARQEVASQALKELGVATVTYPKPYEQLINPCALLSADDFQVYTGKPQSTLAEETLALTPINQGLDFSDDTFPSVERRCERLEIDRTVTDNIASTQVSLRQFRDATAAKSYLEALKTDKFAPKKISPIQSKIALGDTAVIRTDDTPNPALPQRELLIIQGASLLTIAVEGDAINSDKSDQAFESRLIPIGQKVLQNLRDHQK